MSQVRTIDEFKRLSRAGDPSASNAVLRKQVTFTRKAVDDRAVQIVLSTEAPDRSPGGGDVISVAGWQLENFRANPVVLFAHAGREPPVARDRNCRVEGKALLGEPEFTPKDLYPFGDMVGRMVREGFLNAASVGFRSLKSAFNDGRGGYAMDFIEQELLEYSIVPIPANPEALVAAKAAGIELAPLVEWAEQVLDGAHEAGLWLPRGLLEKAWTVARPERLVSVPKADAPPEPPPADTMAAELARLEAAVARLKSVAVRVETGCDRSEAAAARMEECCTTLEALAVESEVAPAEEPAAAPPPGMQPSKSIDAQALTLAVAHSFGKQVEAILGQTAP